MAGTEQLAPGVYRIDAIGVAHAISVFVLQGDDGWTLVDTGLAGSVKRIQAALAALGVTPETLARIYLTHHHSDHIGGLPGMRQWAPRAEIAAPAHDARIIAGEQPLDPASNRAMRFFQRWAKLPVVPVGRTVREGETIAGFRVIATPGHTRGHTSLLSDAHGLLLTADAFGTMPKKLRVGVRKAFCTDPPAAKRSAQHLLTMDYALAVPSHGPVLRDASKATLRAIVAACDY